MHHNDTQSLTSHSLFSQLQSGLLPLTLHWNHVSKKVHFHTAKSNGHSSVLTLLHLLAAFHMNGHFLLEMLASLGFCDTTFPGFLLTSLLPVSGSPCGSSSSTRPLNAGASYHSDIGCLLSLFFLLPTSSTLSSCWPFQNISPTQSSPLSSTHRFSWLPDTGCLTVLSNWTHSE